MNNAIEKKANKKGTVFALVQEGSTFGVWKLCSNYCGQVRGGISKSWRYVQRQLNEADARALFERRIAGTQR
jgi:hypothetical protein